jgi:hypothetical protein
MQKWQEEVERCKRGETEKVSEEKRCEIAVAELAGK